MDNIERQKYELIQKILEEAKKILRHGKDIRITYLPGTDPKDVSKHLPE